MTEGLPQGTRTAIVTAHAGALRTLSAMEHASREAAMQNAAAILTVMTGIPILRTAAIATVPAIISCKRIVETEQSIIMSNVSCLVPRITNTVLSQSSSALEQSFLLVIPLVTATASAVVYWIALALQSVFRENAVLSVILIQIVMMGMFIQQIVVRAIVFVTM